MENLRQGRQFELLPDMALSALNHVRVWTPLVDFNAYLAHLGLDSHEIETFVSEAVDSGLLQYSDEEPRSTHTQYLILATKLIMAKEGWSIWTTSQMRRRKLKSG